MSEEFDTHNSPELSAATERVSAAIKRDSTTTLAELTTLRVGGRPREVVRCASAEALAATVAQLDASGTEILILGGGSNVLAADGELDCVVVMADYADVEFIPQPQTPGEAPTVMLRAGAGAVFDEVVAAAVARGYGGIECLSGIPGSAGAVPVQNVGAYGTEISDVLRRVRLYDRTTGEDSWVPASDLELAYRYSNLKFTGRAVVLAIECQLSADGLSAPLRFGQLSDIPGQRLPVAQVRQQVLELRRAKGMVLDEQDHDTWSAGSFFTNPQVSEQRAAEIQRKVAVTRGDAVAQTMPQYPSPAGVKLSAAWLIEQAGFAKGYPGPGHRATLSTKHTLALTNRGGATAADIAALAGTIIAGVKQAFGVTLVPEPVWLGL